MKDFDNMLDNMHGDPNNHCWIYQFQDSNQNWLEFPPKLHLSSVQTKSYKLKFFHKRIC